MLQLNFTPFPVLETERLLLRQLVIEDEEAIFQLRSDEAVNRYLDRPKARSLSDAREFIEKINGGISRNEAMFWAVVVKPGTALAGTVCYWNISPENHTAEIGYELLPGFQGKGIMQEALTRVIQYGFETMQIHTIEAIAHKDNYHSSKLLGKHHFKRDNELEKEFAGKEEMMNLVVYSLRV